MHQSLIYDHLLVWCSEQVPKNNDGRGSQSCSAVVGIHQRIRRRYV